MKFMQPFGWTFRTLQDAYAPRPPMIWAVTGLFQIPSLSIVYGPPGSLKSMLLADMVACTAAGIPWLEPMPHTSTQTVGMSTKAGPAMWLDFDNGPRRTDDRFDAIGKARNLDPTTPLAYVSMPAGGLFIDKHHHAESLAATIVQYGANLVVIDNLGIVSGDADEISAEMVPVMANLRYVCEWANCALVVVHHQRKGNGSKGREGETLRGHSSIEASLDLALLIEREKNSAEIRLRSTKTRGADVQERGAIFTYQHKPGTQELEQAAFYGIDITPSNPLVLLPDDILQVVTDDGPLNQSEIVKKVQGMDGAYTRHKILDELKRLVMKSLITEKPGPSKNAKIYSV